MDDWPQWGKDVAGDESTRVYSSMSRAATLLIAANALIEERRQLMAMADDVSQLGPPFHVEGHTIPFGRSPVMPESDRISRIAEVETRFQELCRRNSIAPDEPVLDEMRESVQRVLSEKRRATDPLTAAARRLQERLEQTLESGGTDVISSMDEMHRIREKSRDLSAAMDKIDFLGPDAIDPSEFQ
jgi:hypothetical protein